LVMRDGINRLRHAKRYAGQHNTICTTPAWTGIYAGTGRLAGVDPREMAASDVIVIWGTNPVHTQVNVMSHAAKARKSRGAKIVAIDVYRNATVAQADLGLVLRPGTDGALACAVMHCLFRDNRADRAYLAEYTDDPRGLEAHLAIRTPEWASAITGLSVAEIERFATLVGTHPKTYFRLGYGFTRGANGAVAMHAALSIPAVTGAWQHEGGGAFHTNGAIFAWDKTLIEGLDVRDRTVRTFDMSRIGPVLTNEPADLAGRPPVHGLFIQNVNPLEVAPEQEKVKAGFAREDLFVCVHEQFLTETARYADIVLPATMFIEHDDVYQGGGQQHILLGPKLVDPPGECRSNHEVLCALAERLGAEHEGFRLTARELVDRTLQASGHGTVDELASKKWVDCQPPFREAHYLDGFAWPEKKYRFRPDWSAEAAKNPATVKAEDPMPVFPDHWAVTEEADADHPFRLVTAPARNYLNTSFTETQISRDREGAPRAKIHPEDLAAAGIADGDPVRLGNARGEVRITAEAFDGVQPGVIIVESIAPNRLFADGAGAGERVDPATISEQAGRGDAFDDDDAGLHAVECLGR
ncbi:MAG: molybdopterin-dependent oxidoreductase, partial [Pseudomonadota bacterium]